MFAIIILTQIFIISFNYKFISYELLMNSVRRIVFSGIISGNGRQYRNYCDSQNAHGTPQGEQSIREPDITPSWLGFEYCGSNIAAGSNSYCEWHVHIRMYARCYAPHNVSGSIRRVINGWIVLPASETATRSDALKITRLL